MMQCIYEVYNVENAKKPKPLGYKFSLGSACFGSALEHFSSKQKKQIKFLSTCDSKYSLEDIQEWVAIVEEMFAHTFKATCSIVKAGDLGFDDGRLEKFFRRADHNYALISVDLHQFRQKEKVALLFLQLLRSIRNTNGAVRLFMSVYKELLLCEHKVDPFKLYTFIGWVNENSPTIREVDGVYFDGQDEKISSGGHGLGATRSKRLLIPAMDFVNILAFSDVMHNPSITDIFEGTVGDPSWYKDYYDIHQHVLSRGNAKTAGLRSTDSKRFVDTLIKTNWSSYLV